VVAEVEVVVFGLEVVAAVFGLAEVIVVVVVGVTNDDV